VYGHLVTWPCCFGPEVTQYLMAEVCVGEAAHLLVTGKGREREREREKC
jgi:hypothetical protein